MNRQLVVAQTGPQVADGASLWPPGMLIQTSSIFCYRDRVDAFWKSNRNDSLADETVSITMQL